MAGTNQNPRNSLEKIKDGGFSLTEVVITTAIIGTLCSIAYPNYINNLRRSESLEAKARIASIQAVISSYIDETGEMPNTWEQINSITAIMASNGDGTSSQAKSNDLKEIVLPGDHYKLKINAPSGTDTVYTLTANPLDVNSNYDIRSCLDISNGASDLTTGSSSKKAKAPACS
jgi:prepilin-type N-terminal cleavage/methylation domain-containing protein